jgi:predicted nucleic-acid-binding protein
VMICADTNVWARAWLNDDERQARIARLAIATACASEGPAIDASRRGPAGFTDQLIAQVSFAGGVREIITFDKGFGRLARVRHLR